MLDYLQLHRHIPLTYKETFDAAHASPFMAINGATATRGVVAASHPGKHTTRPGKTLMQVTQHAWHNHRVNVACLAPCHAALCSRNGRQRPMHVLGHASSLAQGSLQQHNAAAAAAAVTGLQHTA
jgi:hypothetical protein